jgi:hypothetical protein
MDTAAGRLRLRFRGAQQAVVLKGIDEAGMRANFFVGSDRTKWTTSAAAFHKIEYHDLYPGINLFYSVLSEQIKSDFVLAPGADPDLIRITYEGASHLSTNADGSLVIVTNNGTFLETIPSVYQPGTGGQDKIVARFQVFADSSVGFRVESYDRHRPLIIDPVIAFDAGFGGASNSSLGYAIVTDSTGASYVAGVTQSSNFPVSANAFQRQLDNGSQDAFVVKLDINGVITWATYLGGSSFDVAQGIAVDGSGVYVVGLTGSTDFPTTPGAYSSTYTPRATNYTDAFLTKLSLSGDSLAYSTYFGGTANNSAQSVAVDTSGSAYVTGYTEYGTFPTTVGAYSQRGYYGSAFITKFNPLGNQLTYSTVIGDYYAVGGGIVVDGAGNAFVAGSADSDYYFPKTASLFGYPGVSCRFTYCSCGFVLKLDPTGSNLLFSTVIDSTNNAGSPTYASAITLDPVGDIYVAGYTTALSSFPTTASAPYHGSSSPVGQWGFIAKIRGSDFTLSYSTLFGNSQVTGLATDSGGYLTAIGYATDLPTTPDALISTASGIYTTSGPFVATLDPTGSSIIYASYLPPTQLVGGVAVDSQAAVYVTGGRTVGGIANVYATKFLIRTAGAPGTITVSTNLSGAAFTIVGPATYTGTGTSFTQTNAPAGTYTITFGALQCYSTPAPQTFTLSAGRSINFTGTYQGTATVSVSIVPVGASSASFSISPPIPGMRATGPYPVSQSNVLPQPYTVTFNPVNGFSTPVAQTLAPSPSCTFAFTGTYTPISASSTATLSVSTNIPAGFSIYNSGVQVASAVNSGLTVQLPAPATYTVQYFGPILGVTGYYPPLQQTVNLSPGASVSLTGVYRRLILVSFTGFNDAPTPSDCLAQQSLTGSVGAGILYPEVTWNSTRNDNSALRDSANSCAIAWSRHGCLHILLCRHKRKSSWRCVYSSCRFAAPPGHELDCFSKCDSFRHRGGGWAQLWGKSRAPLC